MNSIVDEILEIIKALNITQDFFFTMVKTTHLRYCGLYEIKGKEFKHINLPNEVSRVYQIMNNNELDVGIYSYHSVSRQINHYIDYNPELFWVDAIELTLYQTYGVTPLDIEQKAKLENSIKQEKIKKTLVYACYLNLITRVNLFMSKKISKSELNRNLKGVGTPLGLSIQNDNIDLAKKLLELGADPNKKSFVDKPIELAFIYSDEMVWHFFKYYREDFIKEVARKGFAIAGRNKNIEIYKLLIDLGCDPLGKDPYLLMPHIFVDYDNIYGLKFLAQHGLDMRHKNKFGETALERAERLGKKELIKFLAAFN